MELHLVRIVGRSELPGRPFLYGTTDAFLSHFGLHSLDDLPDPEDFLSENAGDDEYGEAGERYEQLTL